MTIFLTALVTTAIVIPATLFVVAYLFMRGFR